MSEKFYPSDNLLFRGLGYVWAAPNSGLGMLVGLVGVLSGGNAQVHRGCIEFHGGFVNWTLDRLAGGVVAMTLGHTILGQTEAALAVVRDHEQVHVRQYERWGPVFIPAYVACSVYLWCRGRDLYRDNPFEVEAYALSDPGRNSIN